MNEKDNEESFHYLFFLCYTHYGFLRFISNDLQHVTKGEWER